MLSTAENIIWSLRWALFVLHGCFHVNFVCLLIYWFNKILVLIIVRLPHNISTAFVWCYTDSKQIVDDLIMNLYQLLTTKTAIFLRFHLHKEYNIYSLWHAKAHSFYQTLFYDLPNRLAIYHSRQPQYFFSVTLHTYRGQFDWQNLVFINMHEAWATNRLPMKAHFTIKYSSITMTS